MKYEGDAVQYTAFALVAIESVWPNPDGNELAPDDADLSLIGADIGAFKSDTKSTFGISPDTNDGVVTARDYYGKQGYYKILPLNVTAVRTSTGLDGSTFSVTFTLDDLLLITSQETAMRYATGLPFSVNDLVESELVGALPQLINTTAEGASWRYVKDEELGLSRYRVSGANTGFNVEDLVSVNDTVTIWIYHDPQDFYLKDRLPSEEYFDDNGTLLKFSDDITNVIGSGDRRNQFTSEGLSFDETLLTNLGIINEFSAENLERLLEDNADEEEIESQVPTVTHENIVNILHNFTTDAVSGIMYQAVDETIYGAVLRTFGSNEVSQESVRAIDFLVQKYYNPLDNVNNGVIREGDTIDKRLKERRVAIEQIAKHLLLVNEDDVKQLYYEDWTVYVNHPNPEVSQTLKNAFSYIGIHDVADIESFIHGLNMFALEMNKKIESYVHRYLARQKTYRVRQRFINGRNMLLTEAHGETPYLALKGVVSRIETSVGTNESSYSVTVSGTGYEKVLKNNEVYYDDFFFNSGINTVRADFQISYAYMQPPKAVQHLISRWAAKQVILGTPNDWSLGAVNRYMFIQAQLVADEENDEGTPDKLRPFEEAAKYSPLRDKVPLRGHFVQAEHAVIEEGGLSIDKLRLFTPLNYLDTTRIQEMVRVLNKSFKNPEVESISNVAVELDNKRSIYDNARKLAGLDNFYQFFVDETGRVRYRLSFEAMERTPRPGYTPTIQDYDILADGNSFVTDDSQLVTVVNVYPLVGHHQLQVADLAFIGRSVPEAGKVPLVDMNDDIPEETLSPELFRYGMRSITVRDVYSAQIGAAKQKAYLYRSFFGQPLKKAVVRVRNNTSYRVGETVLVALQRNRKRSRALIELDQMIAWLDRLLRPDNENLLKMYIGVDERILERGKNTYLLTSGEYNIFWDRQILSSGSANYYEQLNANPHRFVAEQFRKTLNFVRQVLPGYNVLTPEYFPTTYWYFDKNGDGIGDIGGAYGWDENRVSDSAIVNTYRYALRAAVMGEAHSANQLRRIMSGEVVEEGMTPHDISGLLNNIRFQNFRATSYFIESVSHNFSYGTDASTTLGLNYGQDNLVLLDPINNLPFGFLSLEKKMRIGYDSPADRVLWNSYPEEKSSLQNMYIEQWQEDDLYKRASFLFNSQYLRNSSNYMYEIATVREGLDTIIDATSVPVSEEPQVIESIRSNNTGEMPQAERLTNFQQRVGQAYNIVGKITKENPGIANNIDDEALHDFIANIARSDEDLNENDIKSKLEAANRVSRNS